MWRYSEVHNTVQYTTQCSIQYGDEHYIIQYTIQYSTQYSAVHNTGQYTIQWSTQCDNTVQYTIKCSTQDSAVHNTYVVHNTVKYIIQIQYTIQCSTQYSAVHNTVQYRVSGLLPPVPPLLAHGSINPLQFQPKGQFKQHPGLIVTLTQTGEIIRSYLCVDSYLILFQAFACLN